MKHFKSRAGTRFLHRFTACLAVLLLCFTHAAMAQIQLNDELRVRSTVPSTNPAQYLQVGVNTAPFSSVIKNVTATAIPLQQIKLNIPTGVNVVSGSISLLRGAVAVPFTLSGTTLTIASFSLAAGDSIKLSYQATAGCAVVPSTGGGFSVSIVNLTPITYTYGGISKIKIDTSNSFPIKFPGLQMKTAASPKNNKAVEFKKIFTDTVPVFNAMGAGSVKNLRITMNYGDASALSLKTFVLKGIGSATLAVSPTISGATATIDVSSTQLASLGYSGGVLGEGQTIHLLVSAQVEKYFPSLKTQYSVDYFADGISCSRSDNATGLIYYCQLYPSPAPYINGTITQYANWCGQKHTETLTIKNNASNIVSNALLNARYSPSCTGCTISSVSVNGVAITPVNGEYFIGTTDIDGDDAADDLPGGVTVTASIIVTPGTTANLSQEIYNYLRGERIDGVKVNNYTNPYNSVSVNSLFVSGPTDLKEGATGTYSVTYSAIENANKFVNASYYIMANDANKTKIPVTKSGISIEGTAVFSIGAVCGSSPSFSLVAETAGCSSKQASLSSTSASTVITCNGQAGGCYGIYTDTVILSKPEINTCESVGISATGHFDHWYKKNNCPAYKNLIVKVYPLNATAPFQWDGTPTISINGTTATALTASPIGVSGGLAYEFTFNGYKTIDTLINSEAIVFNATIKTGGTHDVADKSLYNMRVEFAMRTAVGDTLKAGGWSKGAPLAVYDPEPSLYSYINMNGCGAITSPIQVKPQRSGGTSGGIYVKTISYPAVSGCYYPNANYAAPINRQYVPGANTDVSQAVFPRCLADQVAVQASPVKIVYTDFYGTSCAVDKTVTSTPSTTSYMPVLKIYPTERQQSIDQFTTWNLKIENIGHAAASNVGLRIKPDTANVVLLSITQLKINGVIIPDASIVKDSGYVYINLGAIGINNQKEVAITVKYNKCLSSGTSSLLVQGAYSCETLSPTNFYSFAKCQNLNTSLALDNMAAMLDPVETFPTQVFKFCQNIPVSLAINNIGRANLTNLGFWFTTKPDNVELVGNKLSIGTISIIDQEAISTTEKIDLYASNNVISQKVLSPVGSPNPAAALAGGSPTMTLQYNVQYHCSGAAVNITPIKFVAKAITNCGDEQKKEFVYEPQIAGFEHLKDIEVQTTGSGGSFSGTAGASTTTLRARLKNNATVLVDSAYIQVELPKDISLVSYTPISGTLLIGTPTLTTNASTGITTVEWKLNQSSHIKAGETVGVDFVVKDAATCPPLSSLVKMYGILKRTMTDCASKTCQASAATSAVSVSLTRVQTPLTLTLTPVPTACSGTVATYTATATPATASVSWATTLGTIAATGATAKITFPTAGTATVTATATAAGCPNNTKTASVTTTVGTKPVVSISTLGKQVNSTDAAIALAATPTGGAWSGSTGIVGSTFDPSKAPCGPNTLTYTASNGCGSTAATVAFTVNCCAKTLSINGLAAICLPATATTYTATIGAGSSDPLATYGAISWTLTPTTIGTPNVGTGTTFATTFGSKGTGTVAASLVKTGCPTLTVSKTVTVDAKPTVAISTVGKTITSLEAPITLAATPTGGAWSGSTGIVGSTFDPSKAPCGPNTLTYTASNGCGSTAATVAFTVNCCAKTLSINGLAAICLPATATTYTATIGAGSSDPLATYGAISWTLTPTTIGTPNVGTGTSFATTFGSKGTGTVAASLVKTGCPTLTASKAVTVDAKPTVAISTVGKTITSLEAPITLAATPTGGAWTGSTGIVGSTFDPSKATCDANNKLTYTASNTCGTSTATVSFAVVCCAKTFSISGLDSVCKVAPTQTYTAAFTGSGSSFGTVNWALSPTVGATPAAGTGNSFATTFSTLGYYALTATLTKTNCPTLTATKAKIGFKQLENIVIKTPVGCNYSTDVAFALAASPAGGKWSGTGVLGATFNPATARCASIGANYALYSFSNYCGSDKDSVKRTVHCCLKQQTPFIGDFYAPAGVTTLDVNILYDYVNNLPKIDFKQNTTDCGITMLLPNCTTQTITLPACFLKWADINGDGKIDAADVELAAKQVK